MLNKWILVNNNHTASFSASFLCLAHPSITQSQGQGSVTPTSHGVSGPNDVLGSGAVSRWLITIPFAEHRGSALPGPSDTTPSLMKRAPAAPQYTRAPDDPLTKTQKPLKQFGFPHKGPHHRAKELQEVFSHPHLGVDSVAYLGQTLQPDHKN